MTQSQRRPLTPPERHARSRDVLIRRVFGAVAGGRSLTGIARRRNMPRVRTFKRWLAADLRLRQSYDTALMVQTHVMLDDMVAAADRYARGVRGRRRIAAVRRQIEARKLAIEMLTSASPETKPEWRGLTDADIAVLEAAHARPPENAPSSPPPHPISRRSGARSPSPPGGGEGRGEGDTALETKPEPAPVGEDTQGPADQAKERPQKDPAPKDPPPNSWYPRWFNDDLREPPHEHDWDPFEW